MINATSTSTSTSTSNAITNTANPSAETLTASLKRYAYYCDAQVSPIAVFAGFVAGFKERDQSGNDKNIVDILDMCKEAQTQQYFIDLAINNPAAHRIFSSSVDYHKVYWLINDAQIVLNNAPQRFKKGLSGAPALTFLDFVYHECILNKKRPDDIQLDKFLIDYYLSQVSEYKKMIGKADAIKFDKIRKTDQGNIIYSADIDGIVYFFSSVKGATAKRWLWGLAVNDDLPVCDPCDAATTRQAAYEMAVKHKKK